MDEILIEVNRERSKANRMEVIPPGVKEEIDKDRKDWTQVADHGRRREFTGGGEEQRGHLTHLSITVRVAYSRIFFGGGRFAIIVYYRE